MAVFSPVDFVLRLKTAPSEADRLRVLAGALREECATLQGLVFIDPVNPVRQLVWPAEFPGAGPDLRAEVLGQLGAILAHPHPVRALEGRTDVTTLWLGHPDGGLAGVLALLGPPAMWVDILSPARRALLLLSGHWMDHHRLSRQGQFENEALNRLGVLQHHLKHFRELMQNEGVEAQEAWMGQLLRGWDQLTGAEGVGVRLGPPGEAKLVLPPEAADRAPLYDVLVERGQIKHPLMKMTRLTHPFGEEAGTVLFLPLVGKEWLGVLEVPFPSEKAVAASDLGWLEVATEVMGLALAAFVERPEAKEETGGWLDLLLNALPAGVLVIGKEGMIHRLNPMANLFGEGEAQSGQNFRRFYSPGFCAVLDRLLDGKDEIREDSSAVGTRQLHTVVYPQPDGRLLVICVDETDTKELHSLRDLDQMKSDFVSAASHEIRTPLTSIQGFVKTLLGPRGGNFSEEDKREFYTIILTEAERLTRLVENILDVSRIESGAAIRVNRSHIPLLQWLEKLVGRARAADPNRRYLVNCPEDAAILGDDIKLEHVVSNLLSNAAKYTPEGAEITAGVTMTDEAISIWVVDNGPGVPPEDAPHLFQRFFRGSQEKSQRARGTGLGLFLSRQLVLAHGGELRYEAAEPHGSRFIVTLPVKANIRKNGELK